MERILFVRILYSSVCVGAPFFPGRKIENDFLRLSRGQMAKNSASENFQSSFSRRVYT